MPPWAWLLLALTGAGGASGLGSVVGGQAAASDLVALEAKVDRLDEKLTELHLLIVRYHANDPRGQ